MTEEDDGKRRHSPLLTVEDLHRRNRYYTRENVRRWVLAGTNPNAKREKDKNKLRLWGADEHNQPQKGKRRSPNHNMDTWRFAPTSVARFEERACLEEI